MPMEKHWARLDRTADGRDTYLRPQKPRQRRISLSTAPVVRKNDWRFVFLGSVGFSFVFG